MSDIYIYYQLSAVLDYCVHFSISQFFLLLETGKLLDHVAYMFVDFISAVNCLWKAFAF